MDSNLRTYQSLTLSGNVYEKEDMFFLQCPPSNLEGALIVIRM